MPTKPHPFRKAFFPIVLLALAAGLVYRLGRSQSAEKARLAVSDANRSSSSPTNPFPSTDSSDTHLTLEVALTQLARISAGDFSGSVYTNKSSAMADVFLQLSLTDSITLCRDLNLLPDGNDKN